MSESNTIENIQRLQLQDRTGSKLMLSSTPADRVIVSVEEPGSGPVSDYALSDEDAQEVSAFLNRNRVLFKNQLTKDLGYLAAEGHVIRAIRMYRLLFDTSLVVAKEVILKAAEEAQKECDFSIPVTRMNEIREENEQLKEVLRSTRSLVAKAVHTGFTGEEECTALFRNQAEICRVVPLRPQDRQTVEEMVKKTVK